MMLSPPSAKKLSSMPTRSSPSTSANSPHRISSCGVRGAAPHRRRELRRRQRPAVELAVRRQRQPLQHHKRRRHHVVRKAAPQMRPQRRRIHSSDRPPPPHRPPAACCPADPRAQSPPPAPPPRCRTSAASISPGSMRNPRIFTCASARPRNSSTPSGTPARQVPGPVHPAPRRPKRIRNKPLRRQTRTTQIAPRQSRSRNVKLPRNPSRHRLQTAVQYVNPRVPDRTTDRRHGRSADQRFTHGRADRRLGRTIGIDHPAVPLSTSARPASAEQASPPTISGLAAAGRSAQARTAAPAARVA